MKMVRLSKAYTGRGAGESVEFDDIRAAWVIKHGYGKLEEPMRDQDGRTLAEALAEDSDRPQSKRGLR